MSGDLIKELRIGLEPFGMEAYLFKVAWYNQNVGNLFNLPYKEDTVCAVVLTTPSFFEKAFLPFLKEQLETGQQFARDPIDCCIAQHVKQALETLSIDTTKTNVMYDYELHPNRRPKVLVQTAAHVSGAAFYYQRKHVEELQKSEAQSDLSDENINKNAPQSEQLDNPWKSDKKIYGVAMHPKYGGWFAIRCVIVFETLQDSQLAYVSPVDVVKTRERKIDLLSRFNGNWQDWTYRDVIPVDERYSEKQKLYFSTLPKNRKNIIASIVTD